MTKGFDFMPTNERQTDRYSSLNNNNFNNMQNSYNMMNNMQNRANQPTLQVPEQQSFDTPEMRGSIQQILAENIGEFVVAEFILGTQSETRKQGILIHVGMSFITLFDDVRNIYIVCDIFSIKFVYFYRPGDRPMRDYNALPQSATTNGDGLSARRRQ